MPKKAMIDYGISISLDSSGLVKGEKNAKRVADRITRSINKMRKAEDEFRHAQAQLAKALRTGTITRQEYNRELARERLNVEKARAAQARYEAAIRRQTETIEKNTAAKSKNARASTRGRGFGGDAGNFAGNFASAAGLGGAAAGGARMIGLATGGGGMAGVAGLASAALLMKQSYTAFAKYEDQLIRLQVLFGKGLGSTLNEEFKQLALNTALSRDAITEAAVVWRSYGLTTEGITERVRRMGEVSGGSAERMKLLATALAQVNSVGRLMGGERLQLLNAGFNLQEVAKAAGIQMSEFKKAMEEGRISAEHVNQALVAMTSEGGTHFGYLNEKAKTLNGRMEKLGESINELFIDMGSNSSGFFADSITWAEGFTEQMRLSAKYWGLIASNSPEEEVSNVGPNGEGYGNYGGNVTGSAPGVGYNTTVEDGRGLAVGLGMIGYGLGGRGVLEQTFVGGVLEQRRQREGWTDKEAQADAKEGTPEYEAYWSGSEVAKRNAQANADRREATERRARAQAEYNKFESNFWSANRNPIGMAPSYTPMSADARNEYVSSTLPGQWVNNAIGPLGYTGPDPMAATQAQFAEDQAVERGINNLLGLGGNNQPPALKKIMEERAEAIAKLDEDAKRQQISRSLGSGAVGAGSEYEYLAKSRKAQREYEEQKKRDKERNEKLKEIDEKARQQLEDQMITNEALRNFVANSGSV
jgi:tape measure domain-containing protein